MDAPPTQRGPQQLRARRRRCLEHRSAHARVSQRQSSGAACAYAALRTSSASSASRRRAAMPPRAAIATVGARSLWARSILHYLLSQRPVRPCESGVNFTVSWSFRWARLRPRRLPSAAAWSPMPSRWPTRRSVCARHLIPVAACQRARAGAGVAHQRRPRGPGRALPAGGDGRGRRGGARAAARRLLRRGAPHTSRHAALCLP